MGIFDRFRSQPEPETDERAIERYRYMLATAPPEDIERAHEEAFTRLTPEQRRAVLDQLKQHVPPSEVPSDDPKTLARAATRAEIRQPGTIERAFGGGFAAPGLGSYFLTVLAASFIGTAIAQSFFANDSGFDGGGDGGSDAGSDGADGGSDGGSDADAGDASADAGDTGDFGGDFGGDMGGDFGGGDIGF